MGAARQTDKPAKPKRHRKLPPRDTDEYRIRRDRNNDAVKKSRDKSRARASQTIERVQQLKEENEKLEQQVQILSKELGILRDLFKMVHAGEASGACSVGNSGAAVQCEEVTIKDEDADVSPAAEALMDMAYGSCKPETDGDASSYDGTLVNQEALERDHEYFTSWKC